MDKGKECVRKHSKDSNAQAIYKKVKAPYLKCMGVTIESSRLFSYITNSRIDDGKLKGTTHSYILHRIDQVRIYEEMNDPSEHSSEALQQKMLENAVCPLKELRSVSVTQDQLEAAGVKQGSTYTMYMVLLCRAANEYDSQYETENKFACKCTVYVHDFEEQEEDSSVEYNIDVNLHTLEANATQHKFRPQSMLQKSPHQPGSRLPGSK